MNLPSDGLELAGRAIDLADPELAAAVVPDEHAARLAELVVDQVRIAAGPASRSAATARAPARLPGLADAPQRQSSLSTASAARIQRSRRRATMPRSSDCTLDRPSGRRAKRTTASAAGCSLQSLVRAKLRSAHAAWQRRLGRVRAPAESAGAATRDAAGNRYACPAPGQKIWRHEQVATSAHARLRRPAASDARPGGRASSSSPGCVPIGLAVGQASVLPEVQVTTAAIPDYEFDSARDGVLLPDLQRRRRQLAPRLLRRRQQPLGRTRRLPDRRLRPGRRPRPC